MTSASLNTVEGHPVLRFERRLAHPVDKVWTAITDVAELKHWFPAPFEAELKTGAPIQFKIADMDLEDTEGEVLEVERPRLFVYRWADSVLRWELIPEGDGCRLVFTHTLGGTAPWGDRLSAPRQAAGWDVCLARLEIRLDGRTDDLPPELWVERSELYFERFGLAEGEVRDGVARFEREIVLPADQVRAKVPTGDGARWEVNEQPVGVRLVVTVPGEPTPELLAEWHLRLEAFYSSVHREDRLRDRYRAKLQSHSQ
jgi:uncharacterized protein YndB with AHSA1/START domain